MSDLLAILLLLVVAGLAVVLVIYLLGAQRRNALLTDQLKRLETTQQDVRGAFDQRIVDHERQINQQLSDITHKVGQALQASADKTQESLRQTTERTQKTLKDLGERLAVMDRAQENITQLSNQMVGLQDILSNKQARGAFGEVQLNDLVSSILPPTTYALQHTLGNGKRADCLVKLPNPPGAICIDAKFPLEAYHLLSNAEGDDQKKAAQRRFDQDVRTHIKAIREKYILPGETGEGALMFVPSEAIYAEIHANLPTAVEESRRVRVYITSPTTLWALLNTMRAIFRDVEMHQQAEVIQREVRALLADVGRLDTRVKNLGKHFGQVTKDVEDIQKSTRGITRHGERIDELEFEDEPGAKEIERLSGTG